MNAGDTQKTDTRGWTLFGEFWFRCLCRDLVGFFWRGGNAFWWIHPLIPRCDMGLEVGETVGAGTGGSRNEYTGQTDIIGGR